MSKVGRRTSGIALLTAVLLSFFCFFNSRQKQNNEHSISWIKRPYFEPIKITQFYSNLPYVEIDIDGQLMPAKLDLGFDGELCVPHQFMEAIHNKSFLHPVCYLGIRGKKYHSELYVLPKIKIGRLNLFKTKAQLTSPEFEHDTILYTEDGVDGSPSPYDYSSGGTIGWKLFQHMNLFLDFNHAIAAFCDSLNTLILRGYPIESFSEAPLLINRNLIEFEAVTEEGPLRCVLDTGASYSYLNTYRRSTERISPKEMDFQPRLNPNNADLMAANQNDRIEFKSFECGQKEFGPILFRHLDTPLDIQAIIGMDFIASKLIFVDFANQKIYFSDAPSCPKVNIQISKSNK